jgi:thioester reductase-like protein
VTGTDERLLRLLQEARQKLEFERKRRTEPIAIVGIGCRFPGNANGPAAFWELLAQGGDATGPVPLERWDAEALYDADPRVPGKSYVKRGAFLDSIDRFEPEFFGISPREALGLDPQQRLLLEVTWEALENAAIVPERLKGSAAGVWIGLSLDDYARRGVPQGELERIDAYTALGSARSVAAGRIAYVLGVHGPVLQLDTACSSSLVAVHLACQSLRAGECELAIAGGASVMASPEATIALCKLQALSPDGRCKTFDAAADGYGRGEGCGVIVLKRLSDALRAGDRIHALIRGSAVNHDGRSNGLTAPNGVAQEAVIRAALANGGVEPASVGYVEAHGTGTLLGDPIEVLALSRVYGAARAPEQPLYLGSVKTNFGHLEAAAGIAALIKAALCLARGRLAPHLHLRSPNPKIPWRDLPVRVTSEGRDFPEYGPARLAGVSSFGISGTNAHVVIEQAPSAELPVRAARSAELIVLTARTEPALRAAAARLRERLEAAPELGLSDVAYTLLTARAAFERRWALAAPTSSALSALLTGATTAAEIGRTATSGGKLAFVFSGQGSQWIGMGQQLLEEEPAFRAALGECDRAIARETGWSVLAELGAPLAGSRLARIDVVQPVLFSIQVALAALWRAWGVEPDAVVGHSMGEVAAAYVAGALSLEDAAAVICRRSALLARISGQGEMALVELSMSEASAELSGFEDRLSVAVSNGARSTVISGDPRALAEIASRLEARGVFCRRVKVDVASHSPQVDPLLDELVKVLASVTPRPPTLPMHSTVTSATITGAELGARYWADNLREPVRFAQSIDALLSKGFRLFVEQSPHPLLVSAIEQLSADAPVSGAAVGSLRRDQPERLAMVDALAVLHMHGLELDSRRLFPNGGARLELPTYPWQGERYWLEPAKTPRGARATDHPLLGARLASAAADASYETTLSVRDPAWLDAHRVAGLAVVPAAALLELVRAAAEDAARGAAREVFELELTEPLVLLEARGRRVQVVLSAGANRAAIYSQPAESGPEASWTLHATAGLRAAPEATPARVDLAGIRDRVKEPLDVTAIYSRFSAASIEYGPAFQGLKRLWRGDGEALAEIELGAGLEGRGFGVHPALLDAALQTIVALLDPEHTRALLPAEIGRFVVHELGAASALVHVRLVSSTAEGVVADVTLSDAEGALLAELGGLLARRADASALARLRGGAPSNDVFYRLEWRAVEAPVRAAPLTGTWAVVSLGTNAPVSSLLEGLRALGASAEHVATGDPALQGATHVVAVCGAAGDAEAAMRAARDALALIHALRNVRRLPRLLWVTLGAAAVTEGEDVAIAGASLWGLGRTLMQENPEVRLTLMDVLPQDTLADAVACEVIATDGETEVAWRGARRHGARLVRAAEAPAPAAPEKGWRGTTGSVLITGGLGALGLEAARRLAERGFQRFVLTGRRGMATPGASEAVRELEALGAHVNVVALDVADRDAVAGLLGELSAEWSVRGVIHAAGVLDDGVLDEQTPERFAQVMAPKVLGAWNLHASTEHASLEFFVLLSSIAGTFGSGGQAGYAAANTFLDALAAHRRARGLAAASIAFGPFKDRGLAAGLDAQREAHLRRRGIDSFSITQAGTLLEDALLRREPVLAVAAIDVRQVSAAFEAALPPVWRALTRSRTVGARESAQLAGRGQDPHELTEVVRAEVARVLSISSALAVPLDKPLKDLGLDSLMGLELRNALVRRTGIQLPAALAFRFPTVQALVQHLAGGTAAGERARNAEHPPASVPETGFEADAVLDADLRSTGRSPPPLDAENVLLTGATGFLGAFLLHELLQQTRARIHCLVRGASAAVATGRLIENLRRYGLFREALAPRIVVLRGDLNEPRLGLDPATFERLGEELEAIYNNGAELSFIGSYADLKPSHVNGTREILRLAARGRSKRLHHVSSAAVFDAHAYRAKAIPESMRPREGRGIHLGYTQCKWVAEALVWEAAARGIEVTIHRPAFIAGSSDTGVWNTADFLCRMTKTMIELGAMPSDLEIDIDFSPVDYVARSIVYLSRTSAAQGRAFHLQHPRGMSFDTFGETLKSLGYPLRGVPYEEWVRRVEARPDDSLYPLLPFLMQRWAPEGLTSLELWQRSHRARLTCDETSTLLAGAGIECPPLDQRLIGRYLEFLRAANFIGPPHAGAR